MRSEIAEQPARWLDLVDHQQNNITAAAALLRRSQPELLVFVARGSSDHAAMYGQYLAHNLLKIPAMLSTPSTVTAFGTQLRYPNSVVIAVSQSGESPDLLHTVSAAKNNGVPVIALTNSNGSSLADLADVHVCLSAGPELSVAATKTYTAELLTLFLTLSLAGGGIWAEIAHKVEAAAEVAAGVIADYRGPAEEFTEVLANAERILIVGRGYSMATAKEGALKLMETNSIAASGWSAADATHGPMGQVVPGTPVIALTASPGGRESVHSFMQASRALGGTVIDLETPAGNASKRIDPALIPLIEIIPLQQLALKLALARGIDPDRPAGLKKVTKTV
ncbi:glucosamine--fructose-6-phosphate aminotransferase (isomerizing) [Arthrobacter sp. 1088]|uniref:SIS domain-containing protein n=1 Tax=Arthrobacter sp. 1088 TaxID=2817768 RepID=UPI002854C675|nr:SIS domain-containing protein [Arthrobacter sp. 1088]MDR6685729.1 glucosamine--fructose-6-phosphate aminotransferase (isomerizing) [Arthrobacter sp. 1088]